MNANKFELQWFWTHQLVINPHKLKNIRRLLQHSSKNQGVTLNNKFLSGPDLLQVLIGIIFCLREHQISLSAMALLQVAVPSGCSRCLQFLWQADTEQMVEVDEYKQRVLGRRARQLVQITHGIKWRNITRKTTKIFVKAIQGNVYKDDFQKSVKTPQEEIEIYQKLRASSSKLVSILRNG